MTTGQEDRRLSAVLAGTLVDLPAGLQDLTALEAGEACVPADSAASMALVASTVVVAGSLRENPISKE